VNDDDMDITTMHLRSDVSTVEVGCPHFPTIFALGGALEVFESIGKETVKGRIIELGNLLVSKMKEKGISLKYPFPEKNTSGLFIFDVPNPGNVAQRLAEKNIMVSMRGGGLRVSVHIYNDEADIETFIENIALIVGEAS
jgi:cysteine desulfurase/selenocysteine lyase